MRLTINYLPIAGSLLLSACISKGSNPADPYEAINRQTYKFNVVFDTFILKPPAKLYKAVVPPLVRSGVNNFYNNINMIPTVANDLLQAEWNCAIKDVGRFVINTTIGVGGVFDVATRFRDLPPRSNDLGLTFAKWGDKNSPYIVIPFLGPSTIRDGMGMMFNYTLFTPYPYIPSDTVIWTLIIVRYVDLRSQMLETDKLIEESIDKYAFIRDAYLQHRNYLITGEQADEGTLYVDDEADSNNGSVDYVEEEDDTATVKPNSKQTAKNPHHAAHSTPAT
jgi:phospholipid-binding lipoprotein MlaA